MLKCTIIWNNYGEIQGKIIEIANEESYRKIVIKNKMKKYLLYDSNENDCFNKDLKVGYIINVKGITKELTSGHIEGDFNYKEYLLNNKFVSVLNIYDIDIVKKEFSIYKIKDSLYKYINNNFFGNGKVIIKGLILGDDSEFSDEFKNDVKTNTIMHLFAVSGLHIGLLISIIKTILLKLRIKETDIENIIIVILILYLVVTMFSASILRASSMYLLLVLNKRKKLNLSSCDIISIVFIILLLINPYYIYSLGFILSFFMAFTIILYSPIIKKDSNIIQTLKISILGLIVTFPITININNEINFLSPVVNVIFIYLVSLVIMPVTFTAFIFPILGKLYNYIANSFIFITEIFAKYFAIKINFPSLSKAIIIMYYILIVLFVTKTPYKKILIKCSFVLLIICFLCNTVRIKGNIYFLDLYNGESIFITDGLGKCNCLIDTGDGTRNEVTSFLKRKGINRLDYLILTHNHVDHNGEVESIINNFHVSNIVVSAYDNNEYTSKKILNKTKKHYVKENDVITCGEIKFEVLLPSKYSIDENENSIVLYTRIGNLNYLFLGDTTKALEETLISKDLNVDVIKIAHHGSTTSTSPKFISAIKPTYAIILSGRTKKFNFPKQETLNTLNKYAIITYNTKVDYTIKVTYSKKHSFITKTYKTKK